MNIKKFLFIFLFFFALQQGANAEGPLQVKTRAWPTRITIGDEIKLSIQIERPKSFSIAPPPLNTPLAPFEIKNVEVASYQETARSVQQTFLLRLTVFQLGDLQIPPFAINFTEPSGRSGQAWTEPVRIQVVSVIKDPKQKGDIRPIKGPISLDTALLRALIFGVLAFFLSGWLVIKIILRWRNRKFVDSESLKPPHERAMLELGRLQARALLNEGKTKEFYSELADILRRYLERRFQVETLELTTYEILKSLKEKEFSLDLIEKIREFFENSDLVKFAKFIPPRSLEDRLTGILRDIVERTKPVEEEAPKK